MKLARMILLSYSKCLFCFLLGIGIFITPIVAQEQKAIFAQESKGRPDITRIVISVSGPAKYKHYQKEKPPGLVIEFKTRNVISQIEKEAIVKQGVVKSIQAQYYRRAGSIKGKRVYPLKSLTFELLQSSVYRIVQTDNSIIVEIENPVDLKVEEVSGGEVEITDTVRTGEELNEKKKALQEAILEAEIKLEEEKKKIRGELKSEALVPAEVLASPEKAKEIIPALDKKKIKRPSIPSKIHPGSFKEVIFLIFFTGIGALIGALGALLWKFQRQKNKKKTNLTSKGIVKEVQDYVSQLRQKDACLREELNKYKNLEQRLAEKNQIIQEQQSQSQQLQEQLNKTNKEAEETFTLAAHLEQKLVQKEQQFQEKEAVLEELSQKSRVIEGVNKEFQELKASYQTLEQSLKEKEGSLIGLKEHKENLKEELSSKRELIGKLQDQLSLMRQKVQKEDESAARAKLQKQRPKDEKSASIDLTPLNEEGVWLRIEPKGPIVPLKRISFSGISFESDKELNIPQSCRMSLIFFGSSLPLVLRGKLIKQEKIPETSKYNVKLQYFSLKPVEKKKLNRYLDKIQTALKIKVNNYGGGVNG
ncbi:MAG: hypothetical protein ABIE75_05195 [Candidatus Omnitrophota bacterium]